MKKLESKKFADLVNDCIEVKSLSDIKGGNQLYDGCVTGICSTKIVTSYCDGGAVCTSGIGGSELKPTLCSTNVYTIKPICSKSTYAIAPVG